MFPRVRAIRTFVALLTFLFTPAALQCAAVAGKFFEYDQVAITGTGGLTAIGAQPSINDYGQVSFFGTDTTGERVWVGDGRLPQPMIADDGSIVIRVGATSTSLRRYAPGLASFQTIADSATFNSIDSDPVISRNGRVVVFLGDINASGAILNNTNAGPGIFASIDEGPDTRKLVRLTGRYVEDLLASGGNRNGICDIGETRKPAAELGFDDLGNALFFATYAADKKVAVYSDDNSFVVAFVATPNGGSRGNPVLPGRPLLFSDQAGLWTMRVDVEKDLSGTTRHYHARVPLPVVQINDKLMGMTISQIGGFSASGFAAKDENGNIGAMRRGDHRVAFWAAASTGEQMIVRANHIDSDQDLTPVYSGDSNLATGTSATVSVTVNAVLAATSTTVASSRNPSNNGDSVTFTATVTSAGGTPTGTVTFMDGSGTLGTVPLISGTAQLKRSLFPGQDAITAFYSGDSNFAASSSAPLTQIVQVLSLSSTLNPSNTGQSVTFLTGSTCPAIGPGPSCPSGTVTFKDGTNTLGTTHLIVTCGPLRCISLISAAHFTTSTLSAGYHSITLDYSGDGRNPAFTSAR